MHTTIAWDLVLAGYRLDDTETLMACDLAALSPLAPAPDVALVREARG